MKCAILTIGDELLIGQVVNTNAAFIAQQLNGIGIEIGYSLTLPDDLDEVVAAIDVALSRYPLVIVTGGLGPTHDDITKKALCKYFRRSLTVSEEARGNIQRYLHERNAPWSDAAEEQSKIPNGATIIPNLHGTASGLLFEHDGKYCIVMPGVPHEMEAMMSGWITSFLAPKSGGNVVVHRTLKTTGITESMLAQKIGEPHTVLGNATLAFLPSPSGVRLRISASGTDTQHVRNEISRVEDHIRAAAEKYIYGTDDETLEGVLGKILTKRNLTIAVAESCTGGLIANKLTDIPGSSSYFDRGVITYSDRSKTQLLGVDEDLIRRHGAVSPEVAEAMALGVRVRSGTDIGISTTGIAGPTGGTKEKPEGLVFIGFSTSEKTHSRRFIFGKGRALVKERAAQAALEIVRRHLLGITD